MPRPAAPRRAARPRALSGLAGLAGLALLVSGCSEAASSTVRKVDSVTGTAAYADARYAVVDPGPLTARLLTADILVTSQIAIPESLVRRVEQTKGVTAVLPIGLASASVDGRTLNIASVDPAEFRRFTPVQSAQSDFVWQRLAGGEVAVDTTVPKRLVGEGDLLRLGSQVGAPTLHVGAFAPLVNQIHAAVNLRRGAQLGIPAGNALLVSTGKLTPSALTGRLRKILRGTADLRVLATEFDINAVQTAVLTGGSVAAAVGSFSYRTRANGEISPDAAWVAQYIRTEQVPILGSVTCNKAMFPQLRAALAEVVQRGLADRIHPGEYAGCYYPRYIGRNPANGLSLHSWGIAVDLNVPGNQRGTVGEMDRQVVDIFKRWGFAWGGDWNWTDPMHFELAALVDVN